MLFGEEHRHAERLSNQMIQDEGQEATASQPVGRDVPEKDGEIRLLPSVRRVARSKVTSGGVLHSCPTVCP